MTTNPEIRRVHATAHPTPFTRHLGSLVAVAVLAAALAVGFASARRAPAAEHEDGLVATCNEQAIAAAAAVPAPEGAGAAARRERERAFNACMDDAAARGFARKP